MTTGLIFWLTGLSGAGKSTICSLAAERLRSAGHEAMILDGDEVRAKISPDLGFSRADILENNRRIAHYCQDKRAATHIILVPLISPLAEGRALARQYLADGFFEIYIACDLPTVIARDPKGLYAQAAKGEIKNMIGFAPDSPYDIPDNPDLVVDTSGNPPDRSAEILSNFVISKL